MLSESALSKAGLNGAKAAGILARAAGASGMAGGQTIDILTEGKSPSLEIILDMYSQKTGRLIKAPCVMGCVLAGADDKKIAAAGITPAAADISGTPTRRCFLLSSSVTAAVTAAAEAAEPAVIAGCDVLYSEDPSRIDDTVLEFYVTFIVELFHSGKVRHDGDGFADIDRHCA